MAEDRDWASAPDLRSMLDLERLDRDLFRGTNVYGSRQRQSLYGGQVAAQALRAAGMTVDDDRHPHSLHGYFLRPGRPDLPVLLHVDRDRDGRTFAARHVRAVQDGEVIFSMLASFQRDEESGTFDAVSTQSFPAPEEIEASSGDYVIEMREVTPLRVEGDRIKFPDTMWVRVRHDLPDDRLVRACALTYVSDLGSGFGQVEVDGLGAGGTSIDHAVWFHADIPVDDWMLLELHPQRAIGARGVYVGGLRDRRGVLGLMCAQEVLLRQPRPEQVNALREMIANRGAQGSDRDTDG